MKHVFFEIGLTFAKNPLRSSLASRRCKPKNNNSDSIGTYYDVLNEMRKIGEESL